MAEEKSGCHLDSPCMVQGRLAEVLLPRRTLWTRKLPLDDYFLLHFAKRRPYTTSAATNKQNSADEFLRSTDLAAPRGSLVASAMAAPLGSFSQNSPEESHLQAPSIGEFTVFGPVCVVLYI